MLILRFYAWILFCPVTSIVLKRINEIPTLTYQVVSFFIIFKYKKFEGIYVAANRFDYILFTNQINSLNAKVTII